MNTVRRPLIGVGVFAVAALLATYLIWNTLQRSVTGATDRYAAVFTDVQGLRVGDDVRKAGVRVGRVDAIGRTDDDHARVAFEIRRDEQLYANTEALVRYQNLIGQRYLALAPGSGDAAPLPPGGTIPPAHTEGSFNVSLVLSGFEPLFSLLRPDQVNSLASTLVQALQGNGVSLSALITQAAALADQFAGRRAVVAAAAVVALGVVVVGALHLDREHRLADARRGAADAACAYAPVLATYDAAKLDDYVKAVEAGAPGQLSVVLSLENRGGRRLVDKVDAPLPSAP